MIHESRLLASYKHFLPGPRIAVRTDGLGSWWGLDGYSPGLNIVQPSGFSAQTGGFHASWTSGISFVIVCHRSHLLVKRSEGLLLVFASLVPAFRWPYRRAALMDGIVLSGDRNARKARAPCNSRTPVSV